MPSRPVTELRLALRSLLRQPGFLMVALLTLALGVGSVSAIFSVVKAVLLTPLPYPEPDRILRINVEQPARGSGPASRHVLQDWRSATEQRVFSAMGAFASTSATLTGNGEAERVSGYQVTPEFWQVMGLAPLHGRWFGEPEESASERVVVLSHSLWQRRLGEDAAVVGTEIVLDGIAHRVVAVAPPEFRYPGDSAYYVPTWLPASKSERGHSYLSVLARLAPGATIAQANAALQQVNAGLAEQYPGEHAGIGAEITRLPDLLNSKVSEPLLVLMGASALVLLIACANLANLLLARGSQRQRELSVRAALGANRQTLLRTVLAEVMLIALAGGLLGVLFAATAVPLLLQGAPQVLPSHATPGVDPVVVLASLATTLVTVLLFALWPALRSAQASPANALQEGSRGSAGGRRHTNTRGLLVAFEVALSLTLMAGAGLLIESLRRIGEVDVGFDPSHSLVATIQLQPPALANEDPDDAWLRRAAWSTARLEPIMEQLRTLPGVERVAVTDSVPMGGGSTTRSPVDVIGRPVASDDERPFAVWRFVSPDYARALGIPLVRGRFLDARDGQPGAWPTGLVVNQRFVDRYLGGQDPVGEQVDLFGPPQTIVGVIADTRLFGREEEVPAEVYIPVTSMPTNEYQVVLQVRGDPAAFLEPLRRTLREADAGMPVFDVRALEEVVGGGTELRNFNLQLMLIFSGVALALAALGVYAVVAYGVAQRRQEFGIRMSLGADALRVLRLVLGQGMRLVLLGVIVGLAGALALGRVLSNQLFEVRSSDPWVLGSVTLLLSVVALVACTVPALRAARIAPMLALR